MVASLITNSTAKLGPSFFLFSPPSLQLSNPAGLCSPQPLYNQPPFPAPPPCPATNRSVARRLEGLSLLPPPPLALHTHILKLRGERGAVLHTGRSGRGGRGGGGEKRKGGGFMRSSWVTKAHRRGATRCTRNCECDEQKIRNAGMKL
ncbi:hypothetical protein AMECASPLE_022139 [Ameca splendens]|uniref:Uncharacterized protein n=1 Tax=Ameca splendens TaxID=208324 RepID=A0ABV0YEU2_9TELE